MVDTLNFLKLKKKNKEILKQLRQQKTLVDILNLIQSFTEDQDGKILSQLFSQHISDNKNQSEKTNILHVYIISYHIIKSGGVFVNEK
jgi:hypothetical protein